MKPWPKLTRRRLLATTVATAAGIGGLGIYTWLVEPHWLQIVHRSMPVRNLPPELIGASLLHASDLHIGPQVDDAYLARAFSLIRSLAPEIVVYTGDFISNHTDIHNHAPRLFSQLACGTLGTLGILGNHDYGSGWHDERTAGRVVTMAEEAGVRILRNEQVSTHGLTIVGMDDLWADRFDPVASLSGLDAADPAIVLVHNPDAVDQVGWGDYSGWILAGHTHGGQCKPPFLPPPLLPVRNRQYTCGEFTLTHGRHLYISRGVGHLTRVRFNVRPELTLFKLTPDPDTGDNWPRPV